MRELLHEAWLSILGAGCLALGCLMWAVQTWAVPYLPLVVYAVGAAGLVGYGVYLRRQPDEQAPGQLQQPAGADTRSIAMQIAPLVAGALVSALWLLAPVRAFAVEVAVDMDVQLIDAVTGDPSPSVRASACQAMLASPHAASDPALQQALARSSKLDQACLRPAAKAGLPAATELMWRTKRSLADRLMSSANPLDDQQACQVAQRLASLKKAAGRLTLVECALGAPTDGARSCCATALGEAPSLAQVIGPPKSVAADTANRLLLPLAQRVFFTKAHRPGASWATASNRRWMWGLACEMADGAHPRAQSTARRCLGAMTSATACGWSKQARGEDFESLPWRVVCADLHDKIDAKASPDAVCSAIHPPVVAEAVDDASQIVDSAIATYSLHHSAAIVSATPVGAGKKPTSDEQNAEDIRSMTLTDIYGKDSGVLPKRPDCAAYMLAQIPGADELLNDRHFMKMKGSAFDCGSLGRNTTIGQAQDQLNKTMATGHFDPDAVVNRGALTQKYGKKATNAVMGKLDKVGNE